MNDIHVLRLNEEKWFCDSCNKLCKLKKIIETLLIPLKSEISRKSEPKIIYESVSNNPIPFSFNQNQSLIYQKQIFEGLNLPQDLCPDIGNCKNGYKYPSYNLKLENTGITLYLENDVRQLKEHRGTLITQLKLILIKRYFNHFFVCSILFILLWPMSMQG